METACEVSKMCLDLVLHKTEQYLEEANQTAMGPGSSGKTKGDEGASTAPGLEAVRVLCCCFPYKPPVVDVRDTEGHARFLQTPCCSSNMKTELQKTPTHSSP